MWLVPIPAPLRALCPAVSSARCVQLPADVLAVVDVDKHEGMVILGPVGAGVSRETCDVELRRPGGTRMTVEAAMQDVVTGVSRETDVRSVARQCGTHLD